MPEANIRDRYGHYAAGGEIHTASFRRRLTPSTEPLNTGASVNLNFVGLTTPPMSPPPAINDTALALTPLHMRHAATRATAASPQPLQANVRHILLSESSKALSPGKVDTILVDKEPKSKRYFRKSIGLYHCKSVIRTAVAIPKQTYINRCSCRGSSVYSRDTKGMSVLQDPTCTPVISDESGTNPPPDEPSPGHANSTDLVRSKIDDWDLHIGTCILGPPPVHPTNSGSATGRCWPSKPTITHRF